MAFLGCFHKARPGTPCPGAAAPRSEPTVPPDLSLLGLFHAGVVARAVPLHAFEVRHADVCPVAPDGHQVCGEGGDP